MSDVGTVSLNAIGSFTGPASHHFYVAAFVLEAVFFGAFVVTYGIGSWILLHRARPQRRHMSNVILLAANTLMFLLTATHFGLDIVVARHGYIDANSAMEAAKFIIYVSQTLLADGFMIYRVFVVYNRSWAVIFTPAVLLVVDGIVGYTSTFLGIIGFYMSVGFYSLSLFINIICTVLIMWRVFRLTREFEGVYPKGSKLKIWKVIEATVQSTVIYSAASVSLVVTFVNSTAVGYPTCLNIFPALIGLVFSFIVIRVALNSRRDFRPDSQLHGSSTGRQISSTAPCLKYEDPPGMHQVLESTATTTITTMTDCRVPMRAESFSDVIMISHGKVESEVSLALPQLDKYEEGR